MRTFIAINLEPEIKRTLSLLIQELGLQDKERRSIKWVRKEGMHLTLKFLGEIKEDKVSQIENVLKNTVKNFSPFSIKIKGTGSFPSGKKNPRVFWVGVKDEKNIKALHALVEDEMEKLGFPKERREFHPHLTLGRVKIFSDFGHILNLLDQYKERHFGEMMVKKITFFRSILKPSGAEYSVLSEFELK